MGRRARAPRRQCLAAFAIVFLWQFPHFMAIAWMYREDYAVPAISYYLEASPRMALSPGKRYFQLWHFSQWPPLLQFVVRLELFTLPALSLLEVSFSTTAHALLFNVSFLHGSCFLLPSSISRRCLRSSRWTRMNAKEGKVQNDAD